MPQLSSALTVWIASRLRVRALSAMIAAAVSALALAGCGLGIHLAPPGPVGTTTTAPGPAAPTVQANELATPPGPTEHATGAAGPQAALREFATLYINWDAADVADRLRRLAADSVGQARTAMTLEASQTGADAELAQGGVSNSGSVQALAPVGAGAGPTQRWVVVTLEQTAATNTSAYQGLAPAWHLTLAQVSRRGRSWVVSGWQPES